VTILRPYQSELLTRVRGAWADGAKNVVMRLDTGGGKTAILSEVHATHVGASCVAAHRQELVGQLSMAFARNGLRHNIIAADGTRREIARAHVEEFGQCYYTPGAQTAVASVDTLIRAKGLESWAAQVTLWTTDEGHHVVTGNKWSRAIERFTNPAVRGLLPTATPARADGKGLGLHADGFADAMVEGPRMRWLIEQGYLTDYKLICPTSDLDVLTEPGASGDWSSVQLREAAKRSHIVGDVVQQYLKWGRGKLGITFCTDVETALETTAAFNLAGVRAETLTGKTLDHIRRDMLRRYRLRQIDQLVTVDIVSEGFDLPAIEIESMARPTQSLTLFMQQFGRALRPIYAPGFDLSTQLGRLAAIAASSKPYATIVDHVSNTMRHLGPPDRPRFWTLDRRGKGKKTATAGVPYRICIECIQPYERTFKACPFCGHYPEPQGRSSPAMVDGDLAELDAATLARLRGEVAEVDASEGEEQVRLSGRHVPPLGIMAGVKRHRSRAMSQATLRESMAQYGGIWHARGYDDSRIQRLFFHTFGVDVMTAATLGADDADALRERVDGAVNAAMVAG
jgi:DNA repair protein RadD